jgi:hypothetical protein
VKGKGFVFGPKSDMPVGARPIVIGKPRDSISYGSGIRRRPAIATREEFDPNERERQLKRDTARRTLRQHLRRLG